MAKSMVQVINISFSVDFFRGKGEIYDKIDTYLQVHLIINHGNGCYHIDEYALYDFCDKINVGVSFVKGRINISLND